MPTTTTGVATSFIDFTRASNATVTDSDGKVKWAPHNLLTNSESFDASAWTKYLAPITANAQVAPNGTTTADTVTTSDNYSSVNQTLAVLTGATYTLAFYAKRGTMTDAKLSVRDVNNAADIVAATSYYSATNSSTWSLVTQSFTVPAGCTTITVHVLKESFAAGTIHLWGAALYRSDLGGMQPNTSAYPMYNPTTPKNLLGYTEDFSNAAWIKGGFLAFGAGSTVNATIAPNGLPTADLMTPDTTVGLHRVVGPTATVLSGTPFRYTVYVKPNGYTKVAFREMATTGDYAAFSLTGAGSVLDKSASATASISALPDGWYLISTSIAAAATLIRYTIYVLDPSYTSGTVEVNWTPNGTSGVYLWGAQFSDSASLDPYVPVYGAAVTSAAYYGPRRDFDGATLACKGLLVEEQRANLLLHSAAFDNVVWTPTGVTIAANVAGAAAVAPDGTNTADKWQETAGGSGHALTESASVTTGVTYTFSVYAKAAENSYIGLFGLKNSVGKFFNLSNGTVGNNISAAPAAFDIYPVGNGWYRCWIQDTEIATTSRSFQIYSSKNGTNWDYSGTLNDGIYLWGAQLEANASFATSYIPTGASSATRNADVASVSTQAFPYSATEGTLVANGSVLSTAAGNRAIATLHQSSNTAITTGNNVSGFGATTADFYVINGGSDQAVFYFNSAVTTGTPFKVGGFYKANNFNGSANGTAGALDTSGSVPSDVTEMRIGRSQSGTVAYFNGHIRQITYLPRAVTTAELQTRTA